MGTRTTQASSVVRDMIDRACARDTPARLHFTDNSDEDHIARIRLIKLEDNEIYADAPLSADPKTSLSKRQPVIVHTRIEGSRYAFRTRVERVFTKVDLNAHKRITAITLALPNNITQQQRRQCFRVSVAGHADIHVAFCATVPGQPDCCPINAEQFRGRMVNISAGGLCVIVPMSQRRRFGAGERLFVEFALPEIDEPFQLSVEVRRTKKVHEDTDTLLGLRFKTDLAWPARPLIQQITRFIANEERRQLRRRREP